ncbi:hypothetical protein MHYP_G00150560 [Metynnis hypsauchen]
MGKQGITSFRREERVLEEEVDGWSVCLLPWERSANKQPKQEDELEKTCRRTVIAPEYHFFRRPNQNQLLHHSYRDEEVALDGSEGQVVHFQSPLTVFTVSGSSLCNMSQYIKGLLHQNHN